jgi:predicted RNase H-like HicB family nuclease
VFIFNVETNHYNGYLPDLAIAAEGATLEETIAQAQQRLGRFFELALKYNTDVPAPSALDKTYDKWKGYKVMYVTTTIK